MLEKNNIDTQVNRINSTGYPSFFLLDENAVFDVHSTYSLTASPRWMYPTHLKEARYSLVLTAGESLQSSEFCVFSDSRIYLRFSAALPEISLDGLTCSLSFLDVCGNARLQIGTFEVLGGTACSGWRIVELDLSWLAGASGRLLVECGPGPENDPTADWLALSDICISRMHEQKVLLARTHHEVRVKNEIAHFSAAYRNELYSKVQDRQSQATGGVVRNIRQLKAAVDIQLGGNVDMKIMEPTEGEAAYTYATRLLRTCLADSPPDYKARLREKVKHHGTLKVLSLCSGAARIEAGFAAAVPDGIEWSLLDINEDLLHMAAKQFSPQTPLDLIVANANELSPTGERWDVIICVSALHHLVELEKVMSFISNSLTEEGEFWSIGEAVGRNGNRLWPEAIEAADAVFSALPSRYRLNANTKVVDDVIPDKDHSIACFEGIRSEEISALLECWLKPVEVYRLNCFLWRMVDLAYSDNFDLSMAEDRNWIIDMVKAEVQHYRKGGRGTELFGVYSRRHV